MIMKLLAAYHSEGDARITIAGDDIAIDDRSATPLALFFHELATNSAKYGALGTATGTVRIELDPASTVCLTWTDRGGPPVRPRQTTGFGTRLIEMSIGRQLGGSVTWNWCEAGLQVCAEIPKGSLIRS